MYILFLFIPPSYYFSFYFSHRSTATSFVNITNSCLKQIA